MGSGASTGSPSSLSVSRCNAPPENVDSICTVDPSRFISTDQEIVHRGEVWKLNWGQKPEAPREWLQRSMWLTNTGGLFYYSRQFRRPLGCYIARLDVRPCEKLLLGRFAIELHTADQPQVHPTILAVESEEARQEWVRCLQLVQQHEQKRGEDKIDPLEPFVGLSMRKNRKRLSNPSGDIRVRLSTTCDDYDLIDDWAQDGVVQSKCEESFGDHLMAHCTSIISERSVATSRASTGPNVFSPTRSGRGSYLRWPPVRHDSQANFAEKLHTVLVLDWDDTLFPTTFVRKDCGLDWRYSIEEQVREGPGRDQVEQLLDTLSAKVEAFVDAACALSQVVIITLASSPWVETSSHNFMPRLEKLLQEHQVKVIYAREKISAEAQEEYAQRAFKTSQDEANFWMRAKAKAMEDEFNIIHGRGTGQQSSSWKNIISIGDSDFERVALMTVAAEHFSEEARRGQIVETGTTSSFIKDGHLQRLRAKTIKMLDEPTCEEMIAQVTLFVRWLPHIVTKDASFDVDLQGSADDNHLEEVNFLVTGQHDSLSWAALAGLTEG